VRDPLKGWARKDGALAGTFSFQYAAVARTGLGLPPVPGPLAGRAEGQREPVQPPLGEHLDSARAQPVADLLQAGRVVAGGEAVRQFGEADPGPPRLPFGPLMTVEPDLGRVGEVGADLDERRAEALIPQVEVVAGHPPAGLGEGELRRRCAGFPPVGGPDPLELLGHPDRRHPRDPVQALDIQRHMTAQHLIHRHHACAHDTLRNHRYAREDEPGQAI
jgi:hypothetical protein